MATPNIFGNVGPDGASRRLIDQNGQKKVAIPSKKVDANGTKITRGSVPMSKKNPGLDDNGRRGSASFDAGTPKSQGF